MSQVKSIPEINCARILGFSGHPMSGLWQIHLSDGNIVFIESGHGMRQIAAAFGSPKQAVGQLIEYSVDDLGVLAGFTPVEGEE